jgi:hypothetical protein
MSIARRFASVLASAFDESCLFKEDCSFDDIFDDLKMRNMISPRDSQTESRRHARRSDKWNTLSHRCESLCHRNGAQRRLCMSESRHCRRQTVSSHDLFRASSNTEFCRLKTTNRRFLCSRLWTSTLARRPLEKTLQSRAAEQNLS